MRFPVRAFLAICALAFGLLLEYELARSSAESLYLEAWGSESLTTAWLVVAVVVTLTVTANGALAERFSLRLLFAGGCVLSAALAFALTLPSPGKPTTLALYVWKDVHVVVLLEMLWTHANHRFAERAARWSYGIICFVGTLGSLCGGLLVGALAERIGTLDTLRTTAPLLLLLAFAAPLLETPPRTATERPRLDAAWRTFAKTSYLRWLFALIFLVQIVITVVDFQYNAAVEQAYPDTDARTAVMGEVQSWISALSMTLQLATGVVLRGVGVAGVLFAVPLLLGAATLAYAVVPRFSLMGIAKVASKALDYSVFRAAKEILYIPLAPREKQHGKAIIDMFGYRVAKGGASLLLMAALAALGAGIPVRILGLVLIATWVAVTVPLVREHRRRSREQSE